MAIKQILTKYWEGLSTDEKPTGVIEGSAFRETDTRAMYVTYDGTKWEVADLRVRLVTEAGLFIDLPGEFDILALAMSDLLDVVATKTDVEAILDKLGSPDGNGLSDICCHMTRVSKVVERIPIVATPTTLTLESITVSGIPDGALTRHVFLSLTTRKIDNMDQVNDNSLDGNTIAGISQVVQIRPSGGVWTDAMNFVNDQYQVPNAVARPGYKQTSNIDVAGEGKVNGNGTYELRWLLSKADYDSLELRDAYFALEVEHTI